MISLRSKFFSISFLLTISLLLQAQNKKKVPFLAYGNLYSQFEPCGCDPLTDMGGVRRLATLLAKVRKKKPHILTFDLGNNFKASQIKESETFHLKQALDLMKPDASLLNSVELNFPEESLGKRKYVLSHVSEKFLKKHRQVSSYILVKKNIIFGFLEMKKQHPELKKNLESLMKSWKKAMKENKATHAILLFSGTDETLKKIKKQKLFQTIISSNTKHKEDKRIYQEQDKDYLLLRQFDSFHVKMVPMLGRGVLTNQKETLQKSLFISPHKTKKNLLATNIKTKPKLSFLPKVSVYWLSKKYEQGSPLASFLNEYQNYKKNIFSKLAQSRTKDLAHSSFSGATSCQFCHQKAYKKWKNSKHAIAFQTLKEKEKTEDTSCIGCHVVGWKDKGGFASGETSPHLKNVQCENCHGASKKHTKDPRVKTKLKSFSTCTSCHNTTHSPNFDQKKYWKKIAH